MLDSSPISSALANNTYDRKNNMKKNASLTSLNRLAEQVGLFIQYWGFKKIHGQLWTHIYLSSSPISALELGKRLEVSKALVSLSMKDLLEYDLIIPAESPNKKLKLFIANPDVFNVILDVLKKREVPMLAKIEKDFESLEKHCEDQQPPELDREKVDQLGQMISMANLVLQNLIEFKAMDVSPLFDVDPSIKA